MYYQWWNNCVYQHYRLLTFYTTYYHEYDFAFARLYQFGLSDFVQVV